MTVAWVDRLQGLFLKTTSLDFYQLSSQNHHGSTTRRSPRLFKHPSLLHPTPESPFSSSDGFVVDLPATTTPPVTSRSSCPTPLGYFYFRMFIPQMYHSSRFLAEPIFCVVNLSRSLRLCLKNSWISKPKNGSNFKPGSMAISKSRLASLTLESKRCLQSVCLMLDRISSCTTHYPPLKLIRDHMHVLFSRCTKDHQRSRRSFESQVQNWQTSPFGCSQIRTSCSHEATRKYAHALGTSSVSKSSHMTWVIN